jgi:hypothetical protein
MQRTERDRLKYQHLECTLRKVNRFLQETPLSEKGEYALSPFPSRRTPKESSSYLLLRDRIVMHVPYRNRDAGNFEDGKLAPKLPKG